jgi:branched-chain amino acid transport system ATP-binding protein
VGNDQQPLLRAEGITKTFGAVRALNGVSISVTRGRILGLIGPNGSGKTTLFHCISGFLPMTSGEVIWQGDRVTGRRPEVLARLGLVRTFQHVMIFPELTVLEGVERAQQCGSRRLRDASGGTGLPVEAAEIIELAGLSSHRDRTMGVAPYGIQRLANVAMALATAPDLLMLDEPVAGLHPEESALLDTLLRRIRDLGGTTLIIDHNMPFLMPLCDRISVLDAGENLFEGSPAEVRASEATAEVYLGRGDIRNAAVRR